MTSETETNDRQAAFITDIADRADLAQYNRLVKLSSRSYEPR